jgi:hypothetical protein
MPRDDWRKARNRQIGKRVLRQQAVESARDIEARNSVPESGMLHRPKQETVVEQNPRETGTIDREVLSKMAIALLDCNEKRGVDNRIPFTEQEKRQLEILRNLIDRLLNE